MDPLTLYTLGSGLYNVVDGMNQKSKLLGQASKADQEAAAAKLAGEQAYAEQRDSTKFKVKQAPTRAADLTLSLAEQGLDFTRDQAQAAQAQTLAGLRDDPRNVGALLRNLNQIGQGVQSAEQQAGRQSVGAQKIIDDSIYNQQEGERQRLAGLQKAYELDPAMAAYTQATGAADAYRTAAQEASRTAIGDSLAAGAQVAGQLRKTQNNKSAEFRAQQRDAAEQSLQAQLAQPIPIDDPDFYVDQMVSTPMDESGIMPVLDDPEELVQEEGVGNPFATRELLQSLNTYEPATAPFGVPTLNAVNRNSAPVDPITGLVEGMPQADRDPYRPAPTGVQSLDPIFYTSVTDPLGIEGRSPAYQGSGPASTYSPLSPLSQQVFGGLQGYNPLGFEDGGTYIAERGGMTSGEFDHDTNKKAIVDEQTGKKEGELTGGEGVLNEDHLDDIVDFIKKNDEDGLLSFLKGLLQEPQFGYDFA